MNARVSFETGDEHWGTWPAGLNLMDEMYITSGASNFATRGHVMAGFGPPRTWTASITRRF